MEPLRKKQKVQKPTESETCTAGSSSSKADDEVKQKVQKPTESETSTKPSDDGRRGRGAAVGVRPVLGSRPGNGPLRGGGQPGLADPVGWSEGLVWAPGPRKGRRLRTYQVEKKTNPVI